MWIDQSLKIQNMSLKLITLAAFAATAQATPKVTACTAAQTEEMTTCITKEMNLAMKTIKEDLLRTNRYCFDTCNFFYIFLEQYLQFFFIF